MINTAIAQITDEAMTLNHPFAIFIEEYLTGICKTEAVAKKLLQKDKSLKEFVTQIESEMRKIARANGTGAQSAGAPDQEFFRRAEEYYEITEDDKTKSRRQSVRSSSVIDITDLL